MISSESAKKLDGKAAYELAYPGKSFSMIPDAEKERWEEIAMQWTNAMPKVEKRESPEKISHGEFLWALSCMYSPAKLRPEMKYDSLSYEQMRVFENLAIGIRSIMSGDLDHPLMLRNGRLFTIFEKPLDHDLTDLIEKWINAVMGSRLVTRGWLDEMKSLAPEDQIINSEFDDLPE